MAREECLQLLGANGLGRLAVVVQDQPLIFPVNYAMDRSSVVFRTDAGTKLYAAIGRPVAFEIDGSDPIYHEGWSVLVVGIAQEVSEARELSQLAALPLGPWVPGPKPYWVRIRTAAITGRRLRR
jgi:nitroimidazol reductase NimA-like FMN-containing flavoprotein (pyridoxamine 5'-phosphate oxidase superfamily)